MPRSRKSGLPILKHIDDPIDRDVTYSPRQNQPYDPRWLLTGRLNEKDVYETGNNCKESSSFRVLAIVKIV